MKLLEIFFIKVLIKFLAKCIKKQFLSKHDFCDAH